MTKITKHMKEYQLQQIFRMLLDNKSQEEIAKELSISVKTVQRYNLHIDKRYGDLQVQKTDDTLYKECQLFKNRMINLFRGLERVVVSEERHVSGTEKAKCAEIAANIAIDVLKMEAEGIKSVKELGVTYYGKGNRLLGDIQSRSSTETTATEGNGHANNTTPVISDLVSGNMDNSEKSC